MPGYRRGRPARRLQRYERGESAAQETGQEITHTAVALAAMARDGDSFVCGFAPVSQTYVL